MAWSVYWVSYRILDLHGSFIWEGINHKRSCVASNSFSFPFLSTRDLDLSSQYSRSKTEQVFEQVFELVIPYSFFFFFFSGSKAEGSIIFHTTTHWFFYLTFLDFGHITTLRSLSVDRRLLTRSLCSLLVSLLQPQAPVDGLRLLSGLVPACGNAQRSTTYQ